MLARMIKEKIFIGAVAILAILTILPLFHIIFSVTAKGLPVLMKALPPRIITRSLNEGELKLCLNYYAMKAELFYSFMLILAVRFITQDTVRNQV